jgi:hypothetical protein
MVLLHMLVEVLPFPMVRPVLLEQPFDLVDRHPFG